MEGPCTEEGTASTAPVEAVVLRVALPVRVNPLLGVNYNTPSLFRQI